MRLAAGWLVASLALSPLCAAAQPVWMAAGPDRNVIAWDPAIRRGVLPNGLRYAVMRNTIPGGGLSLRLGVGVGSLEETEEERGAAHFVEHLAFGLSNGPDAAERESVFAAAGVEFGRDRNAHTSYYSTTYSVDLPRRDGRASALAMAWLRSVADGANISDEAVAKERGVILAEREARMTPEEATRLKMETFAAPGLKFVDRQPIGTPQSLAAMTSQRLRALLRCDGTSLPTPPWWRSGNYPPRACWNARSFPLFGSWKAGPQTPTRRGFGAIEAGRGLDALT